MTYNVLTETLTLLTDSLTLRNAAVRPFSCGPWVQNGSS